MMRKSPRSQLAITPALVVSVGLAACGSGSRGNEGGSDEPSVAAQATDARETEGAGDHAGAEGTGEHATAEGSGEHREHGESGEHGAAGEGEGEESGEYIGREDAWDTTWNGLRLVLSFDTTSNAFVGAVENTTRQTLCAVRVEVHLSTGIEMGPTDRTDLRPGEKTDLVLPTAGEEFESWTAHPEVSACAGG